MLKKGIIQQEQFGFQQKCSTAHALQNIKNDVMNGFINGQSTAMVLLDMEKAFDTVCHESLIYKMIKVKISPYLIKLVQPYLEIDCFMSRADPSRAEP